MTQNLLMASDGANYGDAFYMITGSEDFNYTIDQMIDAGLLADEDKTVLLQTRDGYRLRFFMVGMYHDLATSGDIEQICLVSEAANSAVCGGLKNNGSSVVRHAQWIDRGIFMVAVNSSAEPVEVTDLSNEWYAEGEDGSTTVVADGTTSAFWSVYRFQPLEVPIDDWENDFRLSPETTDAVPYIVIRDATADTWSYYAGTTITIESASTLAYSMITIALVALGTF